MSMSAISTSLLLSHAVAGLFISYLCGCKLIYASEPFQPQVGTTFRPVGEGVRGIGNKVA